MLLSKKSVLSFLGLMMLSANSFAGELVVPVKALHSAIEMKNFLLINAGKISIKQEDEFEACGKDLKKEIMAVIGDATSRGDLPSYSMSGADDAGAEPKSVWLFISSGKSVEGADDIGYGMSLKFTLWMDNNGNWVLVNNQVDCDLAG
jgi:hypothetical protein